MRLTGSWAIAGILPLISGCADNTWQSYTFPSSAPTVVLAIGGRGGPIRLLAAEGLVGPEPRHLRWELEFVDGIEQLSYFGYSEPLAELGLRAGEVRLGSSVDPLLRASTDRWQVQLDTNTEWAPLPEMPPIRIEPPQPEVCGILDSILLELPDTQADQMRAALPLGPEVSLVSTQSGRSFEIHSDQRVVPRSDLLTDVAYFATYLGPDGRMSALDIWDNVWSGPLGRLQLEVPATGPLERFLEAGAVLGLGEERWVVSSSRRLSRFDGQRWTTLLTGQNTAEAVAAVVLGPSEVLATGFLPGTVHHFRGEAMTLEPFSSDEVLGSALFHDARLGTFLGSSDGKLYRREEGGWVRVGDDFSLGLPVTAIGSFGDSLYLSTVSGVGAEWVPGHGFCEVDRRAPGVTERILRLGEFLLLVSRKCCGNQGNETPTLLLRR